VHKGRIWLILGLVVGVAMALGHFPYLAGAARALAGSALSLVSSGAHAIIDAAAARGAPRRAVIGVAAVLAVLVPGLTAWLCVLVARGALRLRWVVAVLLVVLGAASFAYRPGGLATGTLILGLVAGALAVSLTGPLVAAPLAALAGLLAGAYLPAVLEHGRVGRPVVEALHQAIYDHPGDPLVLHAALLVVAVVPFVLMLRSAVRG
jgi:hypothetical protein